MDKNGVRSLSSCIILRTQTGATFKRSLRIEDLLTLASAADYDNDDKDENTPNIAPNLPSRKITPGRFERLPTSLCLGYRRRT
jgi:hypothetical protein